ncbi:MAG: hypothetical protein HND52_03650 [Ignavibacteriae bacterium]|nr:hypothetical protein [Ignavibacteriota bacterium]NOG97050.1 hypothetical protein [Ignavibacteriota bacterium]
MKLNRLLISKRLKKFGKSKYGKYSVFARALLMKPQSMQTSYLSGRSIPGPELLIRLADQGCDIYELLTSDSWFKCFKLFNKDVGERVKAIRKELNFTKAEFGKQILHIEDAEYSEALCNAWEDGNFGDFQSLINISRIGNVSLYWLLTGEDPPYKEISNSTYEPSPVEKEFLLKFRQAPEAVPIINKMLDDIISARADTKELIKQPSKK